MTKFARNRVADEDYAVTVNMLGIRVYRPGHEEVRFSTKGVRVGDRVLTRFGEILFHAYNTLGLHDRPLFIIGRRKVDRGLGFHYAPRDGSDGLVWTDMILGRVDDKDTAVQKAGRLAGVVAQCPQFPTTLTWWTDEKTKQNVTRHNSVVDQANTKRGCSALQAMTRAEAAVPARDNAHHESVSHLEEFASMALLCTRWTQILAAANKPAQRKPATPAKNAEGAYVCSLGEASGKQTAADIRMKFPEGSSTANWGSGITNAAVGEYVKRVYAGYEDDTPVFFLRWTVKV